MLRIPCSCPRSLAEAEAGGCASLGCGFECRLYLCATAQAQRGFSDAAEICPVPSWHSLMPHVLSIWCCPNFYPILSPLFFPLKKKPCWTEKNQSEKQEPWSCFRVKLQLGWFFSMHNFSFFFPFLSQTAWVLNSSVNLPFVPSVLRTMKCLIYLIRVNMKNE